MNALEDSSRGRLYFSCSLILILTLSVATLAISRPTYAASNSVEPQASATTTTSTSTTTTTASSTTTSSSGAIARLSVSTVDREGDPVSGFTIQALVDTNTGQTIGSGSTTPQTYNVTIGHTYSLTVDDNPPNYVVAANVGTFARTNANGGGGTSTFAVAANTDIEFSVSRSLMSTTTTSTSRSTTTATTTTATTSHTRSTTTTPTTTSTTTTSSTTTAPSTTTSTTATSSSTTTPATTSTVSSAPSVTTITVTSTATLVSTIAQSPTTRTSSAAPPASTPSSTPAAAVALPEYPVQLRLVDLFGQPIAGAQVALTAHGGQVLNAVTNANGTVSYEVPLGTFNATYSYLGVSGHVQNMTQGQHHETVTVALSYPLISMGVVFAGAAATSGMMVWRRHRGRLVK